MRILVADDPALGSFVRKGLEAEHYAVDVSADGEQARAMAGELDFDLLVLDLNLPRLDGVSILRFLRTCKPSMPILVLTGRTRVEDRVQCLDLGADDYLGKPFSFTELSARIRALMRRSHLPAESLVNRWMAVIANSKSVNWHAGWGWRLPAPFSVTTRAGRKRLHHVGFIAFSGDHDNVNALRPVHGLELLEKIRSHPLRAY
jgi:DNA-binding response OmpR family regulator